MLNSLNGDNFSTFSTLRVLKEPGNSLLDNIFYNIVFLAFPGRYTRGVDPTFDKGPQ
jgi:hypothetical protein